MRSQQPGMHRVPEGPRAQAPGGGEVS